MDCAASGIGVGIRHDSCPVAQALGALQLLTTSASPRMQDVQEVHKKLANFQTFAQRVKTEHSARTRLKATHLVRRSTLQTVESGQGLCTKKTTCAFQFPSVAEDESEYRTNTEPANKISEPLNPKASTL